MKTCGSERRMLQSDFSRSQSRRPRVRTGVCLLQRLPKPQPAKLEQDFLQEQEGRFGKPRLGPTEREREARTAMRLPPSEGEEEKLGVAWRGCEDGKAQGCLGAAGRAGGWAPTAETTSRNGSRRRESVSGIPLLSAVPGGDGHVPPPSPRCSCAPRGAFTGRNDSPPAALGCDPASQTKISPRC